MFESAREGILDTIENLYTYVDAIRLHDEAGAEFWRRILKRFRNDVRAARLESSVEVVKLGARLRQS